jgi:hypothetical protein
MDGWAIFTSHGAICRICLVASAPVALVPLCPGSAAHGIARYSGAPALSSAV